MFISRQLEEARVAALVEEQQRMVIEEHLQEVRQQEEKEERLANVTFNDADEVKDVDHSRDDAVASEITDQEREERPYELIADDDTRVNSIKTFIKINFSQKLTFYCFLCFADRGGKRARRGIRIDRGPVRRGTRRSREQGFNGCKCSRRYATN